jgi:hypothetical protein
LPYQWLFFIIGIGYMQGASMQVLWIRLGCSLEEIKGKTSEESLQMATKKISYTYWFTVIITISSIACCLYLIVWFIILYANGREKN